MSKTLDRDRYYATVFGDPVIKYMQDGLFFTGTGEAVSTGEHASKPPPKAKTESMVAKQVEPTDGRVAELKKMHIAKLKPLAIKVAEATGAKKPKLTGKGLKARLVAYIAKNTE